MSKKNNATLKTTRSQRKHHLCDVSITEYLKHLLCKYHFCDQIITKSILTICHAY